MARVTAHNITVDFPIYGSPSRSLKKTFVRAATGGRLAKDSADRVVVRAIDQLSFDFGEGDRIGLLGHNGSGKTTLLRVLAGAYEPVSGTIEVDGRVGSMLSIYLGMDLEATGYENILLRAAIMGLRPREIEPLVDEICEFSELGDYVNMPVRTYSSGMAMRLAFAASTCIAADIILMDEWLSVGDESFQEKAQERLRKLLDRAKIFVLASNDEKVLRANCNKILRLDHGRAVGFYAIEPSSAGGDARPDKRADQAPTTLRAI